MRNLFILSQSEWNNLKTFLKNKRKDFLAVFICLFVVIITTLLISKADSGAKVQFTSDATINLSGADTTLYALTGSEADSIAVSGSTLTVEIPANSYFTIGTGSNTVLKTNPSGNSTTLTFDTIYLSSGYVSQWTVSSSGTGVSFLVGVPEANVDYLVKANGEQINYYKSTSAKEISFSYTGDLTSKAFQVIRQNQPSGGTPIWMLQQPQATSPIPSAAPVDETIPATPTASSPKSAETPVLGSPAKTSLKQILADSEIISSNDVNKLLSEIGVKRNLAAEVNNNQTVVETIVKGAGASGETRNAITNFVTYGTPTTRSLGVGARAGVVNSFKSAFGKLPATPEDWNDVIKISNGRWPAQTSKETEKKAEAVFKKIYLRNPDRTKLRDNASIIVMAYGLRPANRNIESEKAAIRIFTAIYGYNPKTTSAWDIVRAIAYSGATR